MTGSESQSTEKHPARMSERGYLLIIGALLVGILVMASYIVVSSGILGPEYPDEDTPLELQSWGITWTMTQDNAFLSSIGYNYSDMEIRVMELYPSKIGGGGMGGGLLPDSLERINYTQFSVPATPEEAWAAYGHLSGFPGSSHCEFVGYFISDDTHPSQFNRGDRICLYRVVWEYDEVVHVGLSEDYLYQIGWIWSDSEMGFSARSAYEFTLDDGKLYSWMHIPEPSIWDS